MGFSQKAREASFVSLAQPAPVSTHRPGCGDAENPTTRSRGVLGGAAQVTHSHTPTLLSSSRSGLAMAAPQGTLPTAVQSSRLVFIWEFSSSIEWPRSGTTPPPGSGRFLDQQKDDVHCGSLWAQAIPLNICRRLGLVCRALPSGAAPPPAAQRSLPVPWLPSAGSWRKNQDHGCCGMRRG